MKAEIITIGDEIIHGEILDNNSAYIGEKLSESGLEIIFKTSVGDDVKRITEAIRLSLERADLVIATGGLGPTNDDLTKKAIVKAFKRNLVFHEDILKKVEEGFKRRGIKMPKINQNQALLPQGAKALPNQYGSAPGIFLQEGKKLFFALPGVPLEMRTIMENEILPFLKTKVMSKVVIQKILRTTGIIESALYVNIEPLLKTKSPVKIAFLPGYSGVDLKLRVTSESEDLARLNIQEFEKKLREMFNEYIYGEDKKTIEEVVGEKLMSKRKTISVAESCTAGLICAKFTNVPGSSNYFMSGITTYSNKAKIELLKIPEEIIEEYGAVSEQVAILMAEGVRKLIRTDYGLSATGIAGPTGGTEEKPVGLVYLGFAHENDSFAQKFIFGGDRQAIRERTIQAALNLIRLFMEYGAPHN
ncbi:MAG: competence/damage-inducible protein A [candidate division Zixibacteria bacterium]|nr:competence/damage-inducible protein A [candidate division Zixibacteria bacterium]